MCLHDGESMMVFLFTPRNRFTYRGMQQVITTVINLKRTTLRAVFISISRLEVHTAEIM